MLGETRFACLTYHTIGKGSSQYTVSPEQLRSHLAFLKSKGYTVEGFEQLEIRLRSQQTLPCSYAVFTVDDGKESALLVADMLDEYNYRATFFVTRDRSLTKPGYIREPQIQELRRQGFSLGTHGATHDKLTFMPEQCCLEELKGSKEWLEDVIGERVRYMSVPGGYINSRVRRLAQASGYVLAGTCNEWMNSSKNLNLPSDVNRVNIRRQFSIQDFEDIVTGNMNFYLWRQVRAAALAFPKQLLR